MKESALDAVKLSIQTYVVTDAIAAVNAKPDDGEKALKEIKNSGCILIESVDVNLRDN